MRILFASESLWQDLVDNWWFGLAGLALLIGLVAVFHYFFLIRLPLWILCRTIYRLRVHGVENIPDTGPVLLVANHVSYLDPLLILAAAQKRKVRFFMFAPYTRLPGIRWIVRLAKVIPIHEAQLLSYLKLSNYKIGLLINIHVPHLKDGITRFVHNL